MGRASDSVLGHGRAAFQRRSYGHSAKESAITASPTRPPAEVYEAEFVPALFRPFAAVVADAAGLFAGQRVLDVACGTGDLSAVFARGPAGRVLGVDFTFNMLRLAQRKRPPPPGSAPGTTPGGSPSGGGGGGGGGADRQDVHEIIRTHSQAAALRVKSEGGPNDLLDRLRDEPMFKGIDWDSVLDPRAYVGRAPEQVDRFIQQVVEPIRTRYAEALGAAATELRV